jgi:hypothetical protein
MSEGHDEVSQPEAGTNSDEGSVSDEPNQLADTTSRREAIRKAATGAALTGAIWAAPRVEGLSLVPDYAAAATFVGSVTMPRFAANIPFFSSNDFVPSEQNASVPGASGNVRVVINGPRRFDSGANIPVTVTFSSDPPFNQVGAGNLVFRGRNSGPAGPRNGPHGPIPLAPFGFPSSPKPANASYSFTIPEGTNNVGPSPTGNTQWGDLTFNFTFT